MPYLKDRYNQKIQKELKEELGFSSVMAVPKLVKVVLNVGLGEALTDKSVVEIVVAELEQITGQKPVTTRAKEAIANFKIREGDVIGVKVTLRGDKMWDFVAKMVDVVFPRIKDFRGLNPKSVDRSGNLTIGLEDQTVFFEIDANKVNRLRGMEMTFVNTAKDRDSGYKLFEMLGFPFVGMTKKNAKNNSKEN